MVKRVVTLVSCFVFRGSHAPAPGETLEKVCSLLLVLGWGHEFKSLDFKRTHS